MTPIELDFGAFVLHAELFDTPTAAAVAGHLSVTVRLQQWGDELYGNLGVSIEEDALVADIPPGGIAYTRQGDYICIFFGQTPAWPVAHIGRIDGDTWKKLVEHPSQASVSIRRRDPSQA